MGGEEEVVDLFSQQVRSIYLLHGRLDNVHLPLKLMLLLIQLCKVESHVTNDETINNRT